VLAEVRREAELSQEELAFECDLHPTYISQLERGLKSPTVRTLVVLAEVCRATGSAVMSRAGK